MIPKGTRDESKTSISERIAKVAAKALGGATGIFWRTDRGGRGGAPGSRGGASFIHAPARAGLDVGPVLRALAARGVETTLAIADVTLDPVGADPGVATSGVASVLAAPFASGAIVVCTATPRTFDASERALLEELAAGIEDGLVLERTVRTARAESRAFRTMFEASPVGIVVTDLGGTILRANAAMEKMLGYPESALRGQKLADFAHPDDVVAEHADFASVEEPSGTIVRAERRYKSFGGGFITARVTNRLLRGSTDAFAHERLVIVENATSERRFRERLWEKSMLLDAVLFGIEDGVIAAKPDGEIVVCNPAAERMFGDQHRSVASDVISRVLASGSSANRTETRVEDEDGTTRWVAISASPLVGPDEVVRGAVATLRDVTEERRVRELEQRQVDELRALSLVDELTGLHNHRGFVSLAQQQLKVAARAKRTAAVVYVDIDGLKHINDDLGHAAGDRALVATANVLRATFRASDILARLGGDEFVIFATDATMVENVEQRLRQSLASYNEGAEEQVALSFSVGAALYDPKAPSSLDVLLARADSKMYLQKKTAVPPASRQRRTDDDPPSALDEPSVEKKTNGNGGH